MSRVRQREMHPEQAKREADFYHVCVESDRYVDPSYHHVGEPVRFNIVKDFEERLSWVSRMILRHDKKIEAVLVTVFLVLVVAFVVLVTR